tara:strand:+ start:433 stop:651 length:219 start_codon:yes stop_codon:yes gene_type:complete
MDERRRIMKSFEGLKDLIAGSHANDCPQCNGAGEVEVDYNMTHNASRDVGFIETRIEECDMCNGSGEVSNNA